jgi:hypothetical protein
VACGLCVGDDLDNERLVGGAENEDVIALPSCDHYHAAQSYCTTAGLADGERAVSGMDGISLDSERG